MSDLVGATRHTVIVAFDEVFGENLTCATTEAARRLVELAGMGLLGLRGTCTAAASTKLCWPLADLTPVLMVNRPAARRSNASKPHQMQLIRGIGFEVLKSSR